MSRIKNTNLLRNDDALASYFYDIADELTSIAIKITGNVDVDDILSETIIKTFKNRNKIKQPQYLKTWIIRVLINNCNDSLRASNRFVELEADDIEISTDNSNFDFVNDYVSKLPTNYRSIIVLKHFSGLTFSEIAKVLSMNESTVKYQHYKALELLRVEMEEIYE